MKIEWPNRFGRWEMVTFGFQCGHLGFVMDGRGANAPRMSLIAEAMAILI